MADIAVRTLIVFLFAAGAYVVMLALFLVASL